MKRRAYLAALGSGGLAGIAGCTTLGRIGIAPGEDDDYDVGMTRNEFVPAEYEVTVGETVVWKNTSEAVHTVTAYEGGIPDDAAYFATGGFETEEAARQGWADDGSGGFDTRQTFEHTFEVPGTYAYVCIPHEPGGMTGTVIVTE